MVSKLEVDTIAHSGGTTGMTIDSSGHILTPARPSFLAYMSATQSNIANSNSDVTVQFDSEVYDVGGVFNTSTYKFTAPISGTYSVYTQARLQQIDTAADHLILSILRTNSSGTVQEYWQNVIDPDQFDTDSEYHTFFIQVADSFSANDTAHVTVIQGSGTSQVDVQNYNKNSYFGGYLIG